MVPKVYVVLENGKVEVYVHNLFGHADVKLCNLDTVNADELRETQELVTDVKNNCYKVC